jgi:uncharacterized membrane protein YeaQ/YmgE (transglycosylase-associated protein family)
MSNHYSFDATAAAGALVSNGPLLAAAAIDDASRGPSVLPIAAGITGAFVAGIRSRPGSEPQSHSRFEWASIIISGVAAALFVGPVITKHIIGVEATEIAAFVNFVVGLIGSTLVDLILARGKAISGWLMNKGGAVVGIPPASSGETPADGEPK